MIRNITIKKILFSSGLVLALAILYINIFSLNNTYLKNISINFDIQSDNNIEIQVFYAGSKKDNFTENKSVLANYKANNLEHMTIELPTNKVKRLRLDLGKSPGTLKISNIKITGQSSLLIDDTKYIIAKNQIDSFEAQDGVWTISSTEIDPYLVFDPNHIKLSPKLDFVSLINLSCIFVILTLLIIFYKRIYELVDKPLEMVLSYKHGYMLLSFFIIILVIFNPYPFRLPQSGLDPSWMLGLGLTPQQFGSNMIFSYGPLYWLSSNIMLFSNNQPFMLFVFANLLVAFILNYSIYIFLKKAGVNWLSILLILLLLSLLLFIFIRFGAISDYNLPLAALSLCSFCLVSQNKKSLFAWILLILILSISLAIKFNVFAAVLAITLLASVIAIYQHKTAYVIWGYLLSIIGFLVTWHLIGQDVRNIPDYLANAVDFLKYHDSAMSLHDKYCLKIGLFAFTLYFITNFYILIMLYKRRLDKKLFSNFVVILLSLPIWCVIFKHGFVRNDNHVYIFIYIGLILTIINLLLLIKNHWFVMTINIFMILVCCFCFDWGFIKEKNVIKWQMLNNTVDFDSYKEYLRNAYRIDPKIIDEIKDQTVDVFPWDIALLYGYDKNWRNRPMMQSYLAVSPNLDRLNANHFYSDKAPEYILSKYLSIDSRYPLFDEPLTKIAVMERYQLIDNDREFLLLKKKDSYEKADISNIQDITVKEGSEFALPQMKDCNDLIIAEINLYLNLKGQLLNFLLKANQTYINFELEDGSKHRYRIIRGTLPNGVIVSHFVKNTSDYQKLLSNDSCSLPRVKKIKIEAPFTYRRKIDINFKKLNLKKN